MPTPRHSVMISSTYLELKDHRAAVSQAALGLGMHPLDMVNDAALPRDLIDASLAKVDEADAYIGLISYRYGQTPEDGERNPDKLSLTELEYRRARARGIPRCVFIMHDNYPGIPRSAVIAELATADKLNAFVAMTRNEGICAEFLSVDDLKAKAVQSLALVKEMLVQGAPVRATSVSRTSAIPGPPAFYAHPAYLPGNKFHGRAPELTAMRDWAGAAEPIMLFEAIGGMGKSMVTWEWVTNHASQDRADWAGRFWYSFYEHGADMGDFCVTALAYITGRPRADLAKQPMRELAEVLPHHLRQRPFLLVLDGLERVLAAYNRFDAAQLADDQADDSVGATGKSPTDCIRPGDDEFLSALRTAAPSKILISSRLMPRALLNRFGQPAPGVRRLFLSGLDPRDAEQMLRDAGIDGNADRMRRFLDEKFGCHALLVGVVGGLVLNYMKAPGHFDRWVDDPQGGGAVNLADPDIKQRRSHILREAFDGLDEATRELLTRIAMVSTAVAWDVLAALNPTLPPPPEEVVAPSPPDVERDDYVVYLRGQLAVANTTADRFNLERVIADHQLELRENYETARRARANYLAALTAYQQSAAVRAAGTWLNTALADLGTRGLLQCDRQTGTFDLHPVVRGYAVASLDAEVRAQTGQRVADYFAARPQPAYETSNSLQDLATPIQIVQTLNLAGKTKEAWTVLDGDLGSSLFRLERHHDILALMCPLFPRGWLAPPEGVDDLSGVAIAATAVMGAIGLFSECAAQDDFAISEEARKGLSARLGLSLLNNALIAWECNTLARAERILRLSRATVHMVTDTTGVTMCDMILVDHQLVTGAVAEARAGWAQLMRQSPKQPMQNGELEARALQLEARLLFYEGTLTTVTLRDAINRTRELRQRNCERNLLQLSGYWHLANARYTEAEVDFARAIEMARATGLNDTESEAGRGQALALLGHREQAEAAATAAERDPPRANLAELYLALGDHDKARHQALAGYKRYWADGPPYTHLWELQRCRAVLEQLQERVPEMPQFDPAKLAAIPFEADIRRLLKEHEAKRDSEHR